jgi:hypothetical protein
VCARDLEIGSTPEYLPSRSPNCTTGRHWETPGARQLRANYGLIPLCFPPSRTVTREPAQRAEFADGFVD